MAMLFCGGPDGILSEGVTQRQAQMFLSTVEGQAKALWLFPQQRRAACVKKRFEIAAADKLHLRACSGGMLFVNAEGNAAGPGGCPGCGESILEYGARLRRQAELPGCQFENGRGAFAAARVVCCDDGVKKLENTVPGKAGEEVFAA